MHFPPGCSWTCYLANNPDVTHVHEGSALRHWIKHGKEEGRDCSCKEDDESEDSSEDSSEDDEENEVVVDEVEDPIDEEDAADGEDEDEDEVESTTTVEDVPGVDTLEDGPSHPDGQILEIIPGEGAETTYTGHEPGHYNQEIDGVSAGPAVDGTTTGHDKTFLWPSGCSYSCYAGRYPDVAGSSEETAWEHYATRGSLAGRSCCCAEDAACRDGEAASAASVAPMAKEENESPAEEENDAAVPIAAASKANVVVAKTPILETSSPFPPGCTWECYLADNPSLEIPPNEASAEFHYENFGKKGGRDCACGDDGEEEDLDGSGEDIEGDLDDGVLAEMLEDEDENGDIYDESILDAQTEETLLEIEEVEKELDELNQATGDVSSSEMEEEMEGLKEQEEELLEEAIEEEELAKEENLGSGGVDEEGKVVDMEGLEEEFNEIQDEIDAIEGDTTYQSDEEKQDWVEDLLEIQEEVVEEIQEEVQIENEIDTLNNTLQALKAEDEEDVEENDAFVVKVQNNEDFKEIQGEIEAIEEDTTYESYEEKQDALNSMLEMQDEVVVEIQEETEIENEINTLNNTLQVLKAVTSPEEEEEEEENDVSVTKAETIPLDNLNIDPSLIMDWTTLNPPGMEGGIVLNATESMMGPGLVESLEESEFGMTKEAESKPSMMETGPDRTKEGNDDKDKTGVVAGEAKESESDSEKIDTELDRTDNPAVAVQEKPQGNVASELSNETDSSLSSGDEDTDTEEGDEDDTDDADTLVSSETASPTQNAATSAPTTKPTPNKVSNTSAPISGATTTSNPTPGATITTSSPSYSPSENDEFEDGEVLSPQNEDDEEKENEEPPSPPAAAIDDDDDINGSSSLSSPSDDYYREEEEVKKVGGWLSFASIILMIYTAYQMSENPDGICASLCRLVITVIGCVVKILLIPIKFIMGGGRPSGGHYMATPDYRDPYGSRHMELT